LYEPPGSFYYHHWVDTSAGGLIVSEGIIRPVVCDFDTDMVFR
jgi:hypothetical protein